jgi:hypothetical protein
VPAGKVGRWDCTVEDQGLADERRRHLNLTSNSMGIPATQVLADAVAQTYETLQAGQEFTPEVAEDAEEPRWL